MPNDYELMRSEPLWVTQLSEIDVGPVQAPTLIISRPGTRAAIDAFFEALSLPQVSPDSLGSVMIDCHEKAMGPVVSVLPVDSHIPITVTLTANHLDRIASIDENIPVRLHLARPKEEEEEEEGFAFAITPDIPSLDSILKKIPDDAYRIRELSFDGNYPGSTPENWNVADFGRYAKLVFQRIRRFGDPKVYVRIHPEIFTPSGDLGWTPPSGLRPDDLANLSSRIGLHDYVNFIFYISPLTVERTEAIHNWLERFQQTFEMEVPPTLAIDGFPGYGRDIPSNINHVIKHWLSQRRNISLGLGTYLAERSSVLVFPPGTTPEGITKILPDTQGSIRNLMSTTKSYGVCVLHPISYAEFFIPKLQYKIVE